MVLPRAYFSADGLAPEYLEFQALDTVQALCSYLRGTVCTRGLLRAHGVGDDAASATAVTLTWVLRDGVGMVSGLWLAWVGSDSFGRRVKAWRLFADVVNDAALVIDLLAPTTLARAGHTHLFVGALCVSSTLKAFCGVAAGATRAVITQHMALNVEDVADVQAKEGSQETFVTLMGMVLGSYVVSHDNRALDWALFWLLTVVHIWANVRAVRCLRMRTLDAQRLRICVADWMQLKRVLEPNAVARRERIVDWSVDMLSFGVVELEDYSGWTIADVRSPGVQLLVGGGSKSPRIVVRKDADAVEVVAWCAVVMSSSTTRSWTSAVSSRLGPMLDMARALAASGWDLENSRALLGDVRSLRVDHFDVDAGESE